MQDKTVYRVKLKAKHTAKPEQIVDGYLGYRETGKPMEYEEISHARSKARSFGGSVEPFHVKAVRVSYKVWLTIEEHTEYEDGSDSFKDIEDETQSAGEFNTPEEALGQMEEVNKVFGGDYRK